MPLRNTTAKGSLNQKLQEARLQHGWTQQEVANRIGTTVINVSRWERGVTTPGPYFRQHLCDLFGKDTAALGLDHEKQTPDSDGNLPVMLEDREDQIPSVVRADQVPGVLVEQTSPEIPQRRAFHSPRVTLLIGLLAGIILSTTISLLIFPFLISQQVRTIQPSPGRTPVHVLTSPPVFRYSFENGTDGWVKAGHILQMQSSSNVGGYEGTSALQIVFSSRGATDQPYISVNPQTDRPRSGETLSAAIFVPGGTNATVTAHFYVQDSAYHWHASDWVELTVKQWNVLEFLIPSFAGPALQIGLQFLSWPPKILTTLYVDAIEWR